MNLLNQCQLWTDREEDRRIIEAVEALPEAERTPRILSELGRAYNNLAETGGRSCLEKALSILSPLRDALKDDYRWNFRMGYALYHLGEEGTAFSYFRKADQLRPGDEDTAYFIRECTGRLVQPRFDQSFRRRTASVWETFCGKETEIRALLAVGNKEEAAALCETILSGAIQGISCTVDREDDRYQLTLLPRGSRALLWQIVYVLRHAPASLASRWHWRAGQPPRKEACVQAGPVMLTAKQVEVWYRPLRDGYAFRLWSHALDGVPAETVCPLLKRLLREVLGDLPSMRLIAAVEAGCGGTDTPSVKLSDLAESLREAGADLSEEAEAFLQEEGTVIRRQALRDEDTDWRLDVTEGFTLCPELVDGYYAGEDSAVDAFHRNGAAAGFFGWRMKEGSGDFTSLKEVRTALAEAIRQEAGEEAVSFIGWADGLYAGYLDCILWEPEAVYAAAERFFRRNGFRQGYFHTFRRRIQTAYLLKDRPVMKATPETARPVLTAEEIKKLESLTDDRSGYYGLMFQELQSYLVQGITEGRFTAAEARADRDTALWYAYACNNLGEYEWYYRAAQWMPDSEVNARGCGAWYYRYSVALMYCGRLREALAYAERGVKEEPDYPWGFLQAAKLRSHFGDRKGALAAVERGLFLVPGDYEFQTLQQEIRRGAPLEAMEYHWIHPENDQALQEGLDEDADSKLRSISCIVTDEKGLQEALALFGGQDAEPDGPYCIFRRPVSGHPVDLVFLMNRAGLSKLKIGWLRKLKEEMDSGAWLTREHEGDEGLLSAVIVGLDYTVRLRYVQSGSDQLFDAVPSAVRRREEPEAGEDDNEAEVFLKESSWDQKSLVEGLTAAGLDAEAAGNDTVMAAAGAMTAVLCLYGHPKQDMGLPPHQAYVTLAVIGGEDDPEGRKRLLEKVLHVCTARQAAAGVRQGGSLRPAED